MPLSHPFYTWASIGVGEEEEGPSSGNVREEEAVDEIEDQGREDSRREAGFPT